jgi:hypothetical protein
MRQLFCKLPLTVSSAARAVHNCRSVLSTSARVPIG